MDKTELLKNMVVLADNLDEMRLKKDAEVVDGIIIKVAIVKKTELDAYEAANPGWTLTEQR